MKSTVAVLGLALGLLLATANESGAQKYFFSLSGTCKATNSLGGISTLPINTRGLLLDVASRVQMPVSELGMVFNVETSQVEVIRKSTGLVLLVLMNMETEISLNNVAQTQIERYFTISNPDDSSFSGNAVCTTRITRNAETQVMTRFKIQGRFFLKVDGSENEASQIYSGVFSSGAKYVPPVI